MKLKFIILAFCIIFFSSLMHAQESLIGLHNNVAIEQYLQNDQNAYVKAPLKSQAVTSTIPLLLPFFDDFTNAGPYPDTLRWEDKSAFINVAFQKSPVNRGVATLDALDANGKIYENASQYPFMADYLTSRPIRTDSIFTNEGTRKLTPSDSLYFSFYYQPQGLGDNPNLHDSLVLEFFVEYADTTMRIDSLYYPNDTLWINELDHAEGYFDIIPAYYKYDTILTIIPEQWRHIWASEGMTIDTFYVRHNKWMEQVIMPILDTVFFRPDFRFRFRNYASLASSILPDWQNNMDQWNIDYVYLNNNRFSFDTTYHDLSFVDPGGSFLKDFSAMPYRQYAADPYNAIKSQFFTTFTNLDNVPQNASYKYRVYDTSGDQIGTDDQYYNIEWTQPIPPAVTSGSQNIPVDIIVMFPDEKGSFIIKQTLIGDINTSNRLGDSITFVQELKNYYAYDDGIPEVGYGLSTPNSMLAVRFPLNSRDTLQAVDIFFNDTPSRQSTGYLEYFKLMVWNDNHGEPGDTLYTKQATLQGGEAGQFIRFYVDRMVLLSSGFFVGIQQLSSDNINIGFDYSNNMKSRNMYKIYNNPWAESYYEGSVMIRPILGSPVEIAPPTPMQQKNSMAIYPNPLPTSEQTIFVQTPTSIKKDHQVTIVIYDEIGRKVYEADFTQPHVILNHMYNGLYIVKLLNHTTNETATSKLIIIR